ncbi:MAG TPA: ABC transporter substrate-binding protein, partial [Candidatus Binatia bacterium]|nr:ABC transporter substrate-binding protein [Candidatus Binatia bacterium]
EDQMKRVSFLRCFVWILGVAASLPVHAAESQPEKLRVAISSISTSQVNVWTPLDTGLFKKHGLDVELVYISGAPVGAAALLSGEVQITQGGVVGSIASNMKGSGTYIILGGANKFPYQLVVPPTIKEISDLKGKRFAVSRIGSADHSAAMFVLPRFGLLPEKDLNILQVGSVPARFAALVNGSVQGTLLIPPETVKARELGYRILANFSDIDIEYQQNGVYTTRNFINRRPDLLRRFAAAYAEGNHYIHTNPKGTKKIMQKHLQGGDKAIEEAYNDVVVKATPKIPYPSKNGIQTILNFMAKATPEAANAKPEQFIDDRFVKELEDSGLFVRLYR